MFFSKTARKYPIEFAKSNHPMISIGKYTYGDPKIHSLNWPCAVKIGSFCSIGANVQIFMDLNHRTDWVTTFPFPAVPEFTEASYICGHPWAKGDVVIGNDVWLGNDVSILSGVTIGDGAVLGTGTVVAKDIPPYAIAVGNPAKIAKYRFTEAEIGRLLQLQWWNWPMDRIRKYMPLLCGDIKTFL